MNERDGARPVTKTQVIGILTSTLALFFMVAFASRAVEAYRLRNWCNRLHEEISAMTRQRAELEEEARRRASPAWVEEVLRDAGQIPSRAVSVLVTGATPVPLPIKPADGAEADGLPSTSLRLLANAHWMAWRRLILGFD